MSDSFIGEVRAFPYTFAPRGWLECQGQVLNIHDYQALFGVVGFIYGGDNRTTFGLPDLRGRAAIGEGQGIGLTGYATGELQGVTTVTLTLSQLPNHTHDLNTKYQPPAAAPNGLSDTPTNLAYPSRLIDKVPTQPNSLLIFKPQSLAPALAAMSPASVSTAPDQVKVAPHENRQPYLALRFCICYEGIYPIRP